MRASVASLSKKFMSIFFAATLALGLVPAAAFADDTVVPDDAAAVASEGTAAEDAVAEMPDGSDASDQAGDHDAPDQNADGLHDGPIADAAGPAEGEGPIEDAAQAPDDDAASIPAAVERIGETVSLTQPVAQQESTRSYFLAQTLGSTRTVPMVSANLPLDKGSTDEGADSGASVEGDGSVGDDDRPADGEDGEDGEDSDESEPKAPVIAEESTVKGSFTYEGMTFALEEGGETVALVAVDYNRLPEGFVQQQVIVIPSEVSPDGADHYTVARIAEGAFAGLFESTANPDYVGCQLLFQNEELLAEAGISQEEVQRFLPAMVSVEGVADDHDHSAEEAEGHGDEAAASEDDEAAAEDAPGEGIVAMNEEAAGTDGHDHDGTAAAEMIDIDGDGEMDTVANPFENRMGILALGIPASVTTIADGAFTEFGTLQYLVVAEDNPAYASYDGALYSADMTNLRLIPEGRVGAVRVAPSATAVEPEVFSHCPSVDTVVADPESALVLDAGFDGVRTIVRSAMDDEDRSLSLIALICFLISDSYDPESGVFTVSDRAASRTAGAFDLKMQLHIHSCDDTLVAGIDYGREYTLDGCIGFRTSNDGSGTFPCYHTKYSDGSVTWESRAGFPMCKRHGSWMYSFSPTGPWKPLSKLSAVGNHGENISTSLSSTSYNDVYFKCSHLSAFNHCATFHPNGGEFTDGRPSPSFARTRQGVTSTGKLPAVSRKGWKFDGWWTQDSATSPGTRISDNTAVTSRVAFFARWRIDVTFDTCGQGSNSTAVGYTVTSDSSTPATAAVTLPGTKPSRNGWTFAGWYDASSGGTRRGTSTGTTAELCDTYDGTEDGNVTLYARFSASITWNDNSGSYSGSKRKTTVYNSGTTFSSTITVPKKADNTMSRTGYTFNGWTAKITRTSASSTIAATTGTYKVTENCSLTARWAGNTYTVKFNANGGSGGQTADVTATYGSAMPAISTTKPTKTGYTFGGWYDTNAATGGTQYYTAAGASARTWNKTATTTLYARWTANSYTVKFNANGGSGGQSADVKATYGSAMPAISTTKPTRAGYTFQGWYDNATYTSGTQYYTAACASARSWNKTATTTLYAGWKANTYTVKFNANGGSGGQTADVTATYGSAMPTISTTKPTRAGYTFAGWYDTNAATGGTQYYTAACASARTWNKTATTTLYARWTANSYTVKFNANGGSGGQSADVKATYGSAMPAISTTKPTRAGYTFQGWYDNATYTSGTQYYTAACASARSWNKTATTTLYAGWKANTITLTWNSNGGSAVSNTSQTYSPTAKVTLPTAPTRAGYTFKGWFTSTTSSTQVTASTALPTANTTYYAQWTPNDITMTWNAHGGTAVSNTVQKCDAAIALPSTTRVGYTFAGWWTAETGGTQLTASSKVPTANTTYHAHWTAHTYTVALDPNASGATVSPTSVSGTYDQNITLPTPVRTGYDFTGWNTVADGSGTEYAAGANKNLTAVANGSVTLYAQWTPHRYAITYDLGSTQTDVIGTPAMVSANGDGTTSPQWTFDAAKRKATATYTVEMGTVTLPSFTLDGYDFQITGTDITGAVKTHSFTPGVSATHKDLAFTLTWLECPYHIQFSGVKHVTRADEVFPLTDGINLSVLLQGGTYDLDELVASAADETAHGGTYDANRYSSFVGWKLARTNASGALEYLNGTGAAPARTLQIGLDEFGDKDTLYAEPVFTNRPWTIKLASDVQDNSVWPESIEGWIMDAKGRFSRGYDCASDPVPLPSAKDVTRFGYTLTDWSIQPYSDADFTVKAGAAFAPVIDADGVFCVPSDSTYNLLVSPVWTPLRSKVMFDTAAADATVTEATFPSTAERAFTVAFAATHADGTPELPTQETVEGTTYVLEIPMRDNYTFLGYFDEAGRQYYGEDLRAVRTWDKEPAYADDGKTVVPYTLFAHWQVIEQGPDPNVPQIRIPEVEKDSRIKMRETRPRGGSEWIIDARYNGLMQWDSANETPAADDTVVVDVTNFETSESAENFTKRMHDAFDYSEGEGASKKDYYVIGFEILSTGSYVALEDLAHNNHFTLTLKGSDLSADADLVVPSFMVDQDKVRAAYSNVKPGIDDDLVEGEEIVTMFDAGAGSFRNGRITYTKTTVADPAKTPVALPDAAPVRPGYDFLGYSAVPQLEHKAEGCVEFARTTGTIPYLTSRSPKTYYAHWAPHTYDVAFDLNYEGGDAKAYSVKATFGEVAADLTDDEVADSQNKRGDDYTLVGWFDTPAMSGGTMLFDRDGKARGVWSLTVDEPVVYARWAYDTGGDPSVFPPAPGPHIVVADPALLKVSVTGSTDTLDVLDGTYDGIFRFDAINDAGRPTAASSVQIAVNVYEPQEGVGKMEAFENIERDLQKLAPADAPYLQGFRVKSTGDFVSWGAIVMGESFDIDCKGSDLLWDESTFTAPANAHIGAASLEVVYGPNPSYPPFGGGGDDAVEIVNVFDAGVGAFANGKRLLDVRSTLGEKVTLPSADSDLPLPGGAEPTYMEDLGYHFVGWVDAQGNAPGMQDTTSSRTFYARYVQETHRIDFVLGADAESILNYVGGDRVGAIEGSVAAGQPYHGQRFASMTFPDAEYKKTFSRDGYDFLGWFSTPAVTEGTKAYFLTDEGRAYKTSEGVALANLLVGNDEKITKNETMYALWAAKTYTVTWHNNYPDFVKDGVTYPGTKGDAVRDVFRVEDDPQLRYGQPYAIPEIPADERRFLFDAWFMAPEVGADRDSRAKNHVSNDIPTIEGTTYFMPGHYRSLQTTEGLHYYAAWSKTDTPVPHKIYLHPGEHGFYTDGLVQEIAYRFTDTVKLEPLPTGEAGWQPIGWVASDANGKPLSDDGRTVTELPQGTTGDLHFTMTWEHGTYSVLLEGLEEMLDAWEMPAGWQKQVKTFELGDERIVFPTVEHMRKYAEKTGHRFMGWSRTGSEDDVEEGLTPDEYIATPGAASQVIYKAVWKPIGYTVVFDPGTGDPRDTLIVPGMVYDEKTKVHFPTPSVRSGKTGVFGHWGLATQDALNDWAAESEISMVTLVDRCSFRNDAIADSATASGMVDGELVENGKFNDVITIHGVWVRMLSVDAPLTVTIAIDPETGDMVGNDAWLKSSYDDDVRVMGLTYDKTTGVLGGGTEKAFGGQADKVALTIRSVLSGDLGDDADEEQIEKAFENANAFAVNLGQSKTFPKGELTSSFPVFGGDDHLKIRYRLAFDESVVDLRALLKNLPANDAGGAGGWSSQSFPIANLYYTLGLA